jgi:hypothetical protein
MAKKSGKFVDIIVQSIQIRDEIYRQMKTAGMSISDLSDKTGYYGHKIDKSALSKYFNRNEKISQRDVMFLCKMFGIVIETNVFIQKVDPKTLKGKLERLIESWGK